MVTFNLAAAGAVVTLQKTVYFFIERVSLPKAHPRPLHAIYRASVAQPRIDARGESRRNQVGDDDSADNNDKAQRKVPMTRLSRAFVPPTNLMKPQPVKRKHLMSDANLTQDIFIGVDGGATKTIVRVENARGEPLGQRQGGPANIRLSVEDSWQSINDALKEALASSGLRTDDSQHPGLACQVVETEFWGAMDAPNVKECIRRGGGDKARFESRRGPPTGRIHSCWTEPLRARGARGYRGK